MREFEEKKSQGKAVKVTVHSKEENSKDFFSGFRPRIRPQYNIATKSATVQTAHMGSVLSQCAENARRLSRKSHNFSWHFRAHSTTHNLKITNK